MRLTICIFIFMGGIPTLQANTRPGGTTEAILHISSVDSTNDPYDSSPTEIIYKDNRHQTSTGIPLINADTEDEPTFLLHPEEKYILCLHPKRKKAWCIHIDAKKVYPINIQEEDVVHAPLINAYENFRNPKEIAEKCRIYFSGHRYFFDYGNKINEYDTEGNYIRTVHPSQAKLMYPEMHPIKTLHPLEKSFICSATETPCADTAYIISPEGLRRIRETPEEVITTKDLSYAPYYNHEETICQYTHFRGKNKQEDALFFYWEINDSFLNYAYLYISGQLKQESKGAKPCFIDQGGAPDAGTPPGCRNSDIARAHRLQSIDGLGVVIEVRHVDNYIYLITRPDVNGVPQKLIRITSSTMLHFLPFTLREGNAIAAVSRNEWAGFDASYPFMKDKEEDNAWRKQHTLWTGAYFYLIDIPKN